MSFRTVVADWGTVPTGSMEPNIFPGEVIWIDKTIFGPSLPFLNERLITWASPERGDVVTFLHPHKEVLYVKRVIGVPGDTIRIEGNSVTINGHPLAQSIIKINEEASVGIENLFGNEHTFKIDETKVIPHFGRTVTVPPEKVFVMGDFRNNSKDSRLWGFVDQSRIMGKVTAVAISFSTERHSSPRAAIPVQ